jgi:hypothetical protein
LILIGELFPQPTSKIEALLGNDDKKSIFPLGRIFLIIKSLIFIFLVFISNNIFKNKGGLKYEVQLREERTLIQLSPERGRTVIFPFLRVG